MTCPVHGLIPYIEGDVDYDTFEQFENSYNFRFVIFSFSLYFPDPLNFFGSLFYDRHQEPNIVMDHVTSYARRPPSVRRASKRRKETRDRRRERERMERLRISEEMKRLKGFKKKGPFFYFSIFLFLCSKK